MTPSNLTEEKQVLVTKQGYVTRITLNRPRALNAINLEMVHLIKEALAVAESDGSQAIVIEGAGERGLSGGGDIKFMAGDGAAQAEEFIRHEYEMDLMVAKSKVPTIGIMSGITMGGGIGVSGHASLRIVTETSRLAMPEVKIGIVPDVGGHLILAKSSPGFGEYLALTAESFTAADAISLGFADYMIESDRIEEFIEKLAGEKLSPVEIFETAREFAQNPGSSKLLEEKSWVPELIKRAFEEAGEVTLETVTSADAVELASWSVRVLNHILRFAESAKSAKAQEFASTVQKMNPVSLAVTIAQLARTRVLKLTLEEVLADDYRILSKLFVAPNFVEGVRALAIDKDNNPSWTPANVAGLDVAEVARVLAV